VSHTEETIHFANYAEYSKTLRSWLVAYGIGGPVLFLMNEDAPAKISESPHLSLIVTLFVAGVALQILLAFINKWAAWQMYKGACIEDHQISKTYKIWDWINSQSWIDFIIDFCVLVSFSVATWLVLKAVLVAPVAA
jgi:hypothetical protein